ARRLEGLAAKLDEAVRAIEGLDPRLAGARTGDLTGEERDALREAWWRVFEPILATDEIKNRYQGWYGIDYLKHPRLHARGFPLQKHVAEWAGDTRVAPQDRRLVDDAQLAAFKGALEPGDVILERRNWYLSNIGLPGFWPHAALYTGSQAQIVEALADDSDVK